MYPGLHAKSSCQDSRDVGISAQDRFRLVGSSFLHLDGITRNYLRAIEIRPFRHHLDLRVPLDSANELAKIRKVPPSVILLRKIFKYLGEQISFVHGCVLTMCFDRNSADDTGNAEAAMRCFACQSGSLPATNGSCN